MSEHALYRNDPTRVLLPCSVNHSHAAAADFLQNFVVTEAPLCVPHIGFYEDVFKGFARGFAFGFKSLAQETVDTCPVIKLCCGAALGAFRHILDSVCEGMGRLSRFVHHAAASAAHKCRISSSTSAGFATV